MSSLHEHITTRRVFDSLGLACYIAWSFVFWNGGILFGQEFHLISSDNFYLIQGFFTALSALLLALSIKKVNLLRMRSVLLVGFALVSSGAMICAALAGYDDAPSSLFLVGFALSGIGSCLRLGWEEHLSMEGVKFAAIRIGFAYFFGFLLFSLISLQASIIALLLSMILPFCSCTLLIIANKEKKLGQDEEVLVDRIAGDSFETMLSRIPWKLLVVIALTYFSYGATRMIGVTGSLAASDEMGIMVAGGPALACIIGIVFAYFFIRKNTLFAFYVAFPLMALAALLPASFDPLHGGAKFWVILVGAELVKYLVWFLLINGIMKDGVSALLCLAFVRVAQWGGSCLGQLFASAASNHEAVTIGILLSLIIALLVVIGVPFALGGIDASVRPEEGSLEKKVRHIVAQFGLSPREHEVLSIWATGRSGVYIEKKLFISKSTVKTHLNHIYAKTNTNSREGLLELLDSVK